MSVVLSAVPRPMPRAGALRWLSDLLYTRRGLLLVALLGPPLLWFGVVYLGSLFALLANSFFTLDEFSGVVDRSQLSLNNFREMTEPANVDVVLRTVLMAVSVTLACGVIAFPIAYYMARYARGSQKALLYIAVMLPLWSSYLVRLYAWKLLLAKEGAISWVLAEVHMTWLLDALLSTPGIGGNSLSFSRLGTFIVFVYMWLPFMILPIQAAIERIPGFAARSLQRSWRARRHHVLESDLSARHAGHCRRFHLHLLAHAGRLHHSAGDRRLHAVHRASGLPPARGGGQRAVRCGVLAGAHRGDRHLFVDRQTAGGLRCALTPTRAGWGLKAATWAGVLFLHIPLALIILYAFSAEDKSYVFPPPALTTQWFAAAWEREDVWAAIGLSFRVALVSTALAMVLGTLAAAGLARTRFFGRDAISLLLILPIALPGIVTGIALRTAYHTAEIPFSFWTIVVGHATFCVVVVYNNAVARLRRTSPSLIEASMDLGADSFQTIRYVILPQLGSALLAGGLLAFCAEFRRGHRDHLHRWPADHATDLDAAGTHSAAPAAGDQRGGRGHHRAHLRAHPRGVLPHARRRTTRRSR